MKISQISKIENVNVLGSVFAAQNNRFINGEWVEKPYSKKEKNQVKEYLLDQQYSADLGDNCGNYSNTIAACRKTDDSTIKVVCVTYLKGGWEKSVSFVGQVETCHWNLQIGAGSSILNVMDNHNTKISKVFVNLFEEVYGKISNIKIADIKIEKNFGSLLNAVQIETFRYASQWAYYDYSTPDIQWEKAIEAFSHL